MDTEYVTHGHFLMQICPFMTQNPPFSTKNCPLPPIRINHLHYTSSSYPKACPRSPQSRSRRRRCAPKQRRAKRRAERSEAAVDPRGQDFPISQRLHQRLHAVRARGKDAPSWPQDAPPPCWHCLPVQGGSPNAHTRRSNSWKNTFPNQHLHQHRPNPLEEKHRLLGGYAPCRLGRFATPTPPGIPPGAPPLVRESALTPKTSSPTRGCPSSRTSGDIDRGGASRRETPPARQGR